MKQYTQPADKVKTDACEGNSGQYCVLFLSKWPEK